MTKNEQSTGQELEVKFYLSNRETMEKKLLVVGELVSPRVHEVNLRLDTPGKDLAARGSILRLRQDTRARITYKGSGRMQDGVTLRQELEVTVSDFDTAHKLFEALGYQVQLMYEKQRTTYQVGSVEAVMDELPLGDFIELEGPDGESIQDAAGRLGLYWERRIMESYTVLFEKVRQRLGFKFRDLSFENFKDIMVVPQAMGVSAGDRE